MADIEETYKEVLSKLSHEDREKLLSNLDELEWSEDIIWGIFMLLVFSFAGSIEIAHELSTYTLWVLGIYYFLLFYAVASLHSTHHKYIREALGRECNKWRYGKAPSYTSILLYLGPILIVGAGHYFLGWF